MIELLLIAQITAGQYIQESPPDRELIVWLISGIALAGSDLGITENCLGAKTCREINFGLSKLTDKPISFGFVKMGFEAGSLYAIYKVYKRNKSLGRILFLAKLGSSVYLVTRNQHELNKIK